MIPPDYPLRFVPVYKEKVWGGDWHRAQLGANVPPGLNIGESWEIFDRPREVSFIRNGPWAGKSLRALIGQYPESVLGPGATGEQRFPLLVKFIGSADRLSLQVHPPDDYARRHHPGELGKTEMWYVLAADPGARLHIGFQSCLTRDEAARALAEGSFESLVNSVPVHPHEAYYLPAGRVHALGAGLFLAEIQENSDVTYRVYDYHRRDEQGAERELHVERALDVMNYQDTSEGRIQTRERQERGCRVIPLVADEHFSAERMIFDSAGDGREHAGFQILVVTEGRGALAYGGGREPLQRGTVLLLPAGFMSWQVNPEPGVEILRVWQKSSESECAETLKRER